MHLTRYVMYKRIGHCLEGLMKGRILGISGVEFISHLIDKEQSEVIITDYPEVNMQNLPFKNEIFDFVISDQVIEHLENPKQAIQESHRVLKKGGIAIHTTCFINSKHYGPEDFWRFSSEALKILCKDFNEILQCEGWGNRIVAILCFIWFKTRFIQIPGRKWDLRYILANWNEKQFPISTWIVARK